jgi:hypothetical protein
MQKPQTLFAIEVNETRIYNINYIIAARDEDEALYKASIGDTHAEGDGRIGDVLDRTIVSEARAIVSYYREPMDHDADKADFERANARFTREHDRKL